MAVSVLSARNGFKSITQPKISSIWWADISLPWLIICSLLKKIFFWECRSPEMHLYLCCLFWANQSRSFCCLFCICKANRPLQKEAVLNRETVAESGTNGQTAETQTGGKVSKLNSATQLSYKHPNKVFCSFFRMTEWLWGKTFLVFRTMSPWLLFITLLQTAVNCSKNSSSVESHHKQNHRNPYFKCCLEML